MTKREGRNTSVSPARQTAEAKQEHEEKVRRGYEEAENPEKQGDGDPGPIRTADTPED